LPLKRFIWLPLLSSVMLGSAYLFAAQAPAPKSSTPAAKIGDETITVEEVQQSIQPELTKLDRERFRLIEQKLNQMIADRLLAAEAKRRGISVDELLKQEVNAKTAKITDQELDAFMAQNRARLPQGDDAELKLKVWEYLRDQKNAQQKSEYVRALGQRAGVAVYLVDPTAVQIDTDKGFTRGEKSAPVSIVEFSDFQCPFCKAATATMHQIMAQYAGKVRWVFRDFPIANLHPLANKAHEAARCAAEQGKFWEYHDVLFQKSPQLAPAELKKYARELKLDGESFDRCLEAGKHQAAIAADIEDGQRLGVSGTPAFFINGRMLVGAQPAAAFQQVIDSELSKKSAK
jgi:protein-disulfide isomerase